MKFGVVLFPGSNCDQDAYYAISKNLGCETTMLWHKDTSIPSDIEAIILPGGFSYGDYLRCGAIARFSPIMQEVAAFAKKGRYVMGICNGFQILTDSGMLPGALLPNMSMKFVCKDVYLKVENNSTRFTSQFAQNDIIRVPIAHGEGNYFVDTDTLHSLEDSNQIVFRYCDMFGEITADANPNGSINNIAGIINKNRNILGMMPHPERCCDNVLGNDDGLAVFESLANVFHQL